MQDMKCSCDFHVAAFGCPDQQTVLEMLKDHLQEVINLKIS